MPWYRSGQVAITAGQTTVTGTNTDFALNARVGDAFQGPDGRWYEVANIASAAVLSILPAYQGATVAAGSYGLAPMQGYVKELADRTRQIVEQWGGTLAVFGGATDAATLRSNIGAAKSGVNGDITSLTGLTTALSIAQGGTGAGTPHEARSALGLKAAALADILGTVSHISGYPSGSIYERGSNANGEYAKFADGTMICWGSRSSGTNSFSAVGSVFYLGPLNAFVYPAAFSSIPICMISVISGGGLAWVSHGSAVSGLTQSQPFFVLSPIAAASTVGASYVATGRWF